MTALGVYFLFSAEATIVLLISTVPIVVSAALAKDEELGVVKS